MTGVAPEGSDSTWQEAIVVGAGSAGLSCAAELQRRGFDTVVLESADTVGARWRSRYAELRLNSWRVMSHLQGYRMPRRYGRFPSRDNVVEYLEEFTARNQLRVLFGTRLVRVDPEGGNWRVTTSGASLLARYVVIATGFDAVPVMPEWPGRDSFAPLLLHSSEVTAAAQFAGQSVLVVGLGNSGIDLAGHLIDAGATVTVSMRTPPNIARREFLGLPGQPLLVFFGDRIPPRLADSEFALAQRATFGNLDRYGIPKAPVGVYANFWRHGRNPAVDDGFIRALKAGRTSVVGDVRRLDGAEVVLADDTRLRPDVVICATGFRRGLEPYVGHLGILREDGLPVAYMGSPEHPAAPRLYFAGMWGQFSGQIRLGPIHAQRIARAADRDRAQHGISVARHRPAPGAHNRRLRE